MNKLFVFGFGYSAEALARHLRGADWSIAGTARSAERAQALSAFGVAGVPFANRDAVAAHLADTTHLLISTPPAGGKDPALIYEDAIEAAPLKWAGYLSTVGVYGDHRGDWVDENTPLDSANVRGQARITAERDWAALFARLRTPLDIFRLAGIYGPGRSIVDRLLEGRAQRIIKPGQVFNRIHVEDIAAIVAAAIARPGEAAQTRIFNVADDEPAPPQDVLVYAASLLRLPLPPEIPFEQAEMSEMARSFYEDNKRVKNERIKRELCVTLAYPSYREGISAIIGKSV